MPELQFSTNHIYIEKFEYLFSELDKKNTKHTLLIVDDEEDNLQLLKRTLRSEYNILSASNGQEALQIVEEFGNEISLIISDQRMPVMSGTEFFENIVNKHQNIVRILLTGHADSTILMDSVNKCGLFQYVLKPFDPDELKIAVRNGIRAYELLSAKETILKELKELFFTTIKSISSALDAKDQYTSGHSFRVTMYSLILASEMRLEDDIIEQAEMAGLLHDIGKIGISDYILSKPGKLTNEEYEIMKLHPALGKKMLNGIKKLNDVSLWLNSHHERWDGKGYPEGISGEEIPLTSRILAVADTYDAMTTDRSYRKALSHQTAVEEIERCSGSQFDPLIVEVFLRIKDIFESSSQNPDYYYAKYSVLNKVFARTKNDEAAEG